MGVVRNFVRLIGILYILYSTYMPGTSQRSGPHNVWVPPLCEVLGIYAGYKIYHLIGGYRRIGLIAIEKVRNDSIVTKSSIL